MEKTLAILNQMQKDGIIEGWPVQFLPAFNPLLEEALDNATEVVYETVQTQVFTAEYLAAVMLYTGRPKDHVRLAQFFQENALNQDGFEQIIVRHQLTDKWKNFKRRFLSGDD